MTRIKYLLQVLMLSTILSACGGGGGGGGGGENGGDVPAVNGAPTVTSANFQVAQETDLVAVLTATDPEGDRVTFAQTSDPVSGTLTAFAADGTLTYRPNAGFIGADSFTVTASDGSNQVSATITINVREVTLINQAPTVTSANFELEQDAILTAFLTAADPEGDTVTFVQTSHPANGSITVFAADGSFTYRPNAGFHGADSFTITASDGVNEASVTITLNVLEVAPPLVDTTPDVFGFIEQVDVAFSAVVQSNAITVSGLDEAVIIAIIGGEYAIDDGDFTAASNTVRAGQSVTIRVTAANTFNTKNTATLSIGGVSADFNVTTVLDTSAPEVSILFPLPSFSTTSQTIRMRGTASDPEGSVITSLTVGGVEATTDDGFATWQASVPVPLGRTTITVTAQDIEGNIDTNAASVSAATGIAPAAFVTPAGIDFDRENNRAFVLDAGLDVLMVVDLTTRERIIISGNGVGEGPNFQTPTGLDFDSDNNRMLVTDSELGALFVVNLATGERVIVSSNSLGEGDFYFAPKGVAFDSENNRALLLDQTFGIGKVYSVDLTTGDRSRIDLSGVSLDDVTDIAVDSFNGRALVTDTRNHSLTAVNLATGERAFLSRSRTSFSSAVGGGDNDFDAPMSVDIDIENNRALVVDPGIDELGVLFGVDLTTGFRKVLSGAKRDGGFVGTGQFRTDLKSPISVVLNTNSGEALILSEVTNSLLRVGLGNGSVRTIAAVAESVLLAPQGLAFDKDSRKVFMADFIRSAIFSVDLTTGAIGSVSTNTNSAQGPETNIPLSLTYNPNNNSILLIDTVLGLFSIDVFTGNRTIISSDKIGGGNVDFDAPDSIALDVDNFRAFVLSKGFIASVDLSTGQRTLISGKGKGQGPRLNAGDGSTDSIVLDKENSRALVSSQQGFILDVNLETGDRATFTGNGVGEGVELFVNNFGGPDALALDAANNRLILMLKGLNALIAVDLTTRDRTILSGPDVGGGIDFSLPGEIVLDENNVVLVIDSGVDEVIAVDLITGERVIINN